MAYTILVCDDNSLYGSCKYAIRQREKLFNDLWFLVPPCYNGYDMSKCTVTMRYLLPISGEFVTETLELSQERYMEYLKYVVPIDTNLTKECGDIKLNLTFTMLDIDGNVVQRVRKTDNYVLNIAQIPDWDSIVPDRALSALDQRILQQDAQIKALEDLINAGAGAGNNGTGGNSGGVDNLVYDSTNETLQLTSNGVGIGNKVSIRDILDGGMPVVDLDNDSI